MTPEQELKDRFEEKFMQDDSLVNQNAPSTSGWVARQERINRQLLSFLSQEIHRAVEEEKADWIATTKSFKETIEKDMAGFRFMAENSNGDIRQLLNKNIRIFEHFLSHPLFTHLLTSQVKEDPIGEQNI